MRLLKLPKSITQYVGQVELQQRTSLAAEVVKQAHRLVPLDIPLGIGLAASFDLLVAARYYDAVRPENWLWCEHAELDIYPYLNACPSCALGGSYVHHEGNKPASGAIGPATAMALRQILTEHYHMAGKPQICIASGREPVDLAIVDDATSSLFVAEVKASPLFMPPLATKHTGTGFLTTDVSPLGHSKGTLRNMAERDIGLMIPDTLGQATLWMLPSRGLGSPGWADGALRKAIRTQPDAFEQYVRAWSDMWAVYLARDKSKPAFWLTGACGLPTSCGSAWPKNADGSPKGSISDSKTSVGMDRTDDIKKSTFQVLNLGVKIRREEVDGWNVRIGLASNLHAGRHHSSYLAQYENIVWAWLMQNDERPEDWYNLFDGIVAFSKSYTRDPWLKEILDWH